MQPQQLKLQDGKLFECNTHTSPSTIRRYLFRYEKLQECTGISFELSGKSAPLPLYCEYPQSTTLHHHLFTFEYIPLEKIEEQTNKTKVSYSIDNRTIRFVSTFGECTVVSFNSCKLPCRPGTTNTKLLNFGAILLQEDLVCAFNKAAGMIGSFCISNVSLLVHQRCLERHYTMFPLTSCLTGFNKNSGFYSGAMKILRPHNNEGIVNISADPLFVNSKFNPYIPIRWR